MYQGFNSTLPMSQTGSHLDHYLKRCAITQHQIKQFVVTHQFSLHRQNVEMQIGIDRIEGKVSKYRVLATLYHKDQWILCENEAGTVHFLIRTKRYNDTYTVLQFPWTRKDYIDELWIKTAMNHIEHIEQIAINNNNQDNDNDDDDDEKVNMKVSKGDSPP